MRGRMLHDALRRPADSIAYTLELFFDVDLSWQCASSELKDKVVQQISESSHPVSIQQHQIAHVPRHVDA